MSQSERSWGLARPDDARRCTRLFAPRRTRRCRSLDGERRRGGARGPCTVERSQGFHLLTPHVATEMHRLQSNFFVSFTFFFISVAPSVSP
jgi:hypothetical protein